MSDEPKPTEAAGGPSQAGDAAASAAASSSVTDELAVVGPDAGATVLHTVPAAADEPPEGKTVVRSVPSAAAAAAAAGAGAGEDPADAEEIGAAETSGTAATRDGVAPIVEPSSVAPSSVADSTAADMPGADSTVEVHEPIIAAAEVYEPAPPDDEPDVQAPADGATQADAAPDVDAASHSGAAPYGGAAPHSHAAAHDFAIPDEPAPFAGAYASTPPPYAQADAHDASTPLQSAMATLSARPELLVGGAFACGLLIAVVLKRRGS